MSYDGTLYRTNKVDDLKVTSETQSNNTTSGSLVLSGGLGMAKNIYVGGNLSVTGTGTIVGPLTIAITTQASDTLTGAIVCNGGVAIKKDLRVSGTIYGTVSGSSLSITSIGSSPNANGMTLNSSTLNLEPASASYGGIVTTGTQTIAGAKTFSSATIVSDATVSSGYNTGCFVCSGGIGCNNINANGYITSNNVVSGNATNDSSTALNTGALVAPNGGLSVKKSIYCGGYLNLYSTNPYVIIGNGSSTTSTAYIMRGQNSNWQFYDTGTGNTAPNAANVIGFYCEDTGTTPLTIKQTGDVAVLGTLTKGGGSFLISHPDPSKPNYKLRHCFVETNTRGTNIYEYEVKTSSLTSSITLPTYFKHLNERPYIYISAKDVLGYGYGSISED
jgi:hypothetical protein